MLCDQRDMLQLEAALRIETTEEEPEYLVRHLSQLEVAANIEPTEEKPEYLARHVTIGSRC